MQKKNVKYIFKKEESLEYENVKETSTTAKNNFTKNSATVSKLKIGRIKATIAPKSEARATKRHLTLKIKLVVLKIRKSIMKFCIKTYSTTISIFPLFSNFIKINSQIIKKKRE